MSRPTVVIHIPHSSVLVPADLRDDLLLPDVELAEELVRMTDAFTDEIFAVTRPGVDLVVFPVSRLVVDPERFEDADREPMAAKGMGVIYERTSSGSRLRRPPSDQEREILMNRFYRPHHSRLTRAVGAGLRRDGRCLVVDGHSFPCSPLPYEDDQDPNRPDVCIGTDDYHTPPQIRDAAAAAARDQGWSVAIDRPFSGALVPLGFYRRDTRVLGLMIEVNRRLYMDEESGERAHQFAIVQAGVQQIVRAATDLV